MHTHKHAPSHTHTHAHSHARTNPRHAHLFCAPVQPHRARPPNPRLPGRPASPPTPHAHSCHQQCASALGPAAVEQCRTAAGFALCRGLAAAAGQLAAVQHRQGRREERPGLQRGVAVCVGWGCRGCWRWAALLSAGASAGPDTAGVQHNCSRQLARSCMEHGYRALPPQARALRCPCLQLRTRAAFHTSWSKQGCPPSPYFGSLALTISPWVFASAYAQHYHAISSCSAHLQRMEAAVQDARALRAEREARGASGSRSHGLSSTQGASCA